MENASKALVMAGAILVAILIISLGILIFNNFSGPAKEAANMDEQEVAAFNSKITPYLGNAVAGSQVNALLQYCVSVNISATNSGEDDKKITVTGYVTLNPDDSSYNRVETSGKYYTVKAEVNSKGLYTNITITQN